MLETWNDEGLKKTGTVISVIIDKPIQQDLLKEYKIISSVLEIINLVLSGMSGQVVRYTEEGALLFFEDNPGTISCNEAIGYAINLCNTWKRYRLYIESNVQGISEVSLKIGLHWGEVIRHPDGDLWIGKTLNVANKIRGEKDRVVITNYVKQKIMNHLFIQLFNDVIYNFDDIVVYGIRIPPNVIKYETISQNELNNNMPKISVCVIGTGGEEFKLRAVLNSLEIQTVRPFEIIVAVEKNSMIENSIRSKFKKIEIISIDSKQAKNRSSVRNIATSSVSPATDTVCYIDGDTILGPKCIEIATNLIASEPLTVFSPPRLEIDSEINEKDVTQLVNLFLDPKSLKSINIGMSVDYLSINKSEASTEPPFSLPFLPSYTLFVPKVIVDDKFKLLWDENYEKWGEEDIDYTYRINLKGHRLCMPQLPHFAVLHLTHVFVDKETNEKNHGFLNHFARNAKYLLSKFPQLRTYRSARYSALGVPGFKHCVKEKN